LIEPRLLQRRRIDACLPNLPDSWTGRCVALLADLQIGADWAHIDTARRAIDAALNAHPAVVLLAGDYVYHAAREPQRRLAQLRDVLRPLTTSNTPAFGVLGNHDFGVESTTDVHDRAALAETVEGVLEQGGIMIPPTKSCRYPRPCKILRSNRR
jgi:predicted MPP superfamily phosphohydrolase